MAIYADKKDGKLTGRWRVEVQVAGFRKRGRFDTHAEAQAAETEWRKALRNGEALTGLEAHNGTGRPATLQELLDKAARPVWKGSTHGLNSERQVQRIIGRFGDKKLPDITTSFIDDVIAWLEGLDLSPATINRHLSALSAILSWGAQDGREYVAKMPHFEWQEEDEGRIRVLTLAEEQQALDLLEGWQQHEIGAFVACLLDTGCRRGEQLKVKPEQLTNGRLVLWGSQTKSKRTRTITLTPRARDLMAQYLPWTCTRATLRYWWAKVREAMGMQNDPDFVLHACRHTCATRLLERGADPRTVQEWMGHANLTTTMRYLHTSSARLDHAAALLSAISGEVTKLPKVGDATEGEQPLKGTESKNVA